MQAVTIGISLCILGGIWLAVIVGIVVTLLVRRSDRRKSFAKIKEYVEGVELETALHTALIQAIGFGLILLASVWDIAGYVFLKRDFFHYSIQWKGRLVILAGAALLWIAGVIERRLK